MTFATRRRHRWVLCSLVALCACPVLVASADSFDPSRSRFGFEMRTRWGYMLEGVFPRYEGEVKTLPDGRHQVHLRMFTQHVEIVGHPRYTEWTRSSKFFDAQRYPVVVFTSKPYDQDLLRSGGPLAGDLSIRGITRPRTLDVAPSTCERPAIDCDVVASGAVRRSDYDMDDWQMALSDRVVFVLRARLKPAAAP